MNELDLKRLNYPRVSDIIGKQNYENMRGIPLDVLANAAIRGTKVDGYCKIVCDGLLLPDIELEYQPYVDAWVDWLSLNVEAALPSVDRLYDDMHCFSGELDRLVIMKGSEKVTLLDIKCTYAPSITWPVQLSAYKHLCLANGIKVDEICNVHLKKTPKGVKAKMISYVDSEPYWTIFECSLKCYKYFTNKEKIHE